MIFLGCNIVVDIDRGLLPVTWGNISEGAMGLFAVGYSAESSWLVLIPACPPRNK